MFPREYLGFVDPDDYYSYNGILQRDGTTRKYDSLDELVLHIDERRKALNLPEMPHTSKMVQHYLYIIGEAPKDFFRLERLTEDNQVPSRNAINDIHTGATLAYSLSKAALSGRSSAAPSGWVDKVKAEQRAEVCINCPHNVKLKKNSLTKFNNKLAALFTVTRKTKHDAELFDCELCGCPLDIKVHYSESVIKAVTPKEVKSSIFPKMFKGIKDKQAHSCWMRETLEGADSDG